MTPTGCFIDGKWRETLRRFPVTDPATGELLAEVADAGPGDGAVALDAAVAAQDAWAATPPKERAGVLRRAREELLSRGEEFALLITREMGKPLAESRAEVSYAADFLQWFAEEAVRVSGEYRMSPGGDFRVITTRQPVGPCLLISPWNFPLAMITRKIGPALAAGCTALVKPAEDTPLSCLLLAQVLADVGLPPGVVNVLPTSRPAPLVEPLLADPRLRKLSFTGSTEVGRSLLAQASGNVLRTSMELGGNAPFLVFADADLEAAVQGAMLAKLRNGGQSCVAANRFLVEEPVAEEFAALLAERMSRVRLAPGTDPASELGPLINTVQRDRVAGLVDDAVSRGARALTGGAAHGAFFPATVLADVPASARVNQEEIFGPVAPISTFSGEKTALAMANDTGSGLVAYLYTASLDRAVRVAERLETGMVGLNRGLVSNAAAPFGGIKQSGLGREGGFEGISEYLSTKYLALDTAP
ncbi:NAD-dependent succinate-semialdehyde dehydrogenase [Nonomuraea lactucae]|uniref:NAD-dependent succinate-semialdehyde dehydrogenase n=1 Tax=Nonomuraea lactucae TaxID=2249762 RepID=UPI000DE3D152|nr:NAD-dependent succinate-semialdehyde dehydrogenase [Nonomuraea lactucae]